MRRIDAQHTTRRHVARRHRDESQTGGHRRERERVQRRNSDQHAADEPARGVNTWDPDQHADPREERALAEHQQEHPSMIGSKARRTAIS